MLNFRKWVSYGTLLDNNIVIDALKPNVEFEANALKILRLASDDEISGYICANSLTDIFYVIRKAHGIEFAKSKIKGLMGFTTTIPLTKDDCVKALEMPNGDFEDAIVAVCANKVGADCIVSRDEGFAKSETKVAVISPEKLLAKIKKEVHHETL